MVNLVQDNFSIAEKVISVEPYGNGHINDTYVVTCEGEAGKPKRYILQRMNDTIFKNTDQLMENVVGVTTFLKKKSMEAGGNLERDTLTVIPTKTGENYLKAESGKYRMYVFIEGALGLDAARNAEDFYNSAVAFGNFQRMLSEYPAATLHETILNFHNTVDRFENLKKAIAADVCGRKSLVEKEIQFAMDREADCHVICDALAKGEIPMRVTHNDTKLNNVMIDVETGKGVCVIDLDTVMPGSALYDYGDSIRFGANTAAEDETDLSKVTCSLELFEAYTKGFLEGCNGSLTELEIKLMPMGAKLMTLECGMRFLTDYLQGDTYFKTHREGHNLDRARTQFKLVTDMEQKWDEMQQIVAKYLNK